MGKIGAVPICYFGAGRAYDDTAPLSRLRTAATAVAAPSLAHDDTVPPSGLQGAEVMFETLTDKTVAF